MCACSVMSNFLSPYGLQPNRLLYPWDFPGKNTVVGSHFLLLTGDLPDSGMKVKVKVLVAQLCPTL